MKAARITCVEIDIVLTHSKKQAQRAAKNWGMEPFLIDEGADACVCSKNNKFVVWKEPDLKSSWLDDAAVLAHEAVHVMQGYMRSIGEDEPSDEFAAYVVQNVTKWLLKTHFKWKEKKGKHKKHN